MHILLADDQLDTRQLYSLMFRLEGHTTTLAESGEAAIQVASEQAFDVILMDEEMPVMSGLTAIRHIRALPQGQTVPIILFTAHQYSDQELHEAGANLLVRKPILLRDLLEKIRQVRATPQNTLNALTISPFKPDAVPCRASNLHAIHEVVV